MIDINEISIIREKRKTYTLKIEDGKPIIKAPWNISEKKLRDFACRHLAWMEKHIAVYLDKQKKYSDPSECFQWEEIAKLILKASQDLPIRVEYWAGKMNVKYGHISIGNMVQQWGSCSRKGGNLSFNCILYLCPSDIIDSVVVHELSHRFYMNHSDKFYGKVLEIIPDYDEKRKWLLKYGAQLLEKLTASKLPRKKLRIK